MTLPPTHYLVSSWRRAQLDNLSQVLAGAVVALEEAEAMLKDIDCGRTEAVFAPVYYTSQVEQASDTLKATAKRAAHWMAAAVNDAEPEPVDDARLADAGQEGKAA